MAQNLTDNMRWRYGATNPVMIGVATGTVINVGDILYTTDKLNALPASSQSDASSATLNQQLLKKTFLGISAQRSLDGETAEIRVNTTGVFQMDCASSTFTLGELVGGAENSGGDGLLDQSVIGVTLIIESIGRAERIRSSADTSVFVNIESTIMTSGVQNVISGS